MSDNAAQNGNSSFVVDDLLNMIVPFEFPFEGSVLKGKWYKYKTTTPTYVRTVMSRVRGLREQVHELTQKIINAKNDDPDLPKLLAERDELEDQLQRTPYDWMATGVTEWNATIRLVAHMPREQYERLKPAVAEFYELPDALALEVRIKDEGNIGNSVVLPVAKETLDTWPLLLLNRLNEFFSKERTGENPPSPTS